MTFRSVLFSMALLSTAAPATPPQTAAPYPATERGTTVEHPFGLSIPDPYRWLEGDVRTDAKVRAWVDGQSRFTEAYLATLPGRDAIKARLTQLWNFEKFAVPQRRGERLFYRRNSGLQNQYVLYVQDGAGAPRVLIDPNPWSQDGATALAEWDASPDGRYVAYGVQEGGTDWRTFHVVDVASGKLLPDAVEWGKYTNISWKGDGSGFFYGRYAKPEGEHLYTSGTLDQRIYFHKVGTPQSADSLVYATPDRPKLTHSLHVSADGRWLTILSTEDDVKTELVALDLAKAGATPRILIPYGDHELQVAGTAGDRLFVVTTEGAPRKRIVSLDGTAPGHPEASPLIAEGAGTIDSASIVGGRFLVVTMEDAKSVVRRFALDGTTQGMVALPGIGTAAGFAEDEDAPVTYYSFASYNRPATIYRYDAVANASTVFKAPQAPFDPGQYEVTQVFNTSKDGTRVPMFVAHRRGLDLSAGASTLLYGYGGFNIPVLPAFSVAWLDWMEMGGVIAVANLRGGGEYGKAWHDAGKLLHKQNVFDDFIAAAEYLVSTGITRKDRLVINGGSNGGLLVGAVTNQRPDLFAAAIPQVGVMDMARFTNWTAGRFWTGDYGDPAKADELAYNLTYSPYHTIRNGAAYPAILVTTADTDDRVVPAHSFKYAAALQAAEIGPKPHLIRIETRAGHGSGKPTSKAIEEYADILAFAAYWTGMAPPR
ncbi:prolyl oligopeptidase family serine peptidase [Sphingomonas sp.]|uniref:prolyl oligopeptidase family serine peptidase n=1 Tax=Sphingomonas sp. TaxID=28214 RepID=UPI000DB0922B|nr:prolyl oligopeptidase family serine peptidase [Sphingomonas sp.]PZU07078.1 MAG: S9 family peptidase [Sphingomonas sp.]